MIKIQKCIQQIDIYLYENMDLFHFQAKHAMWHHRKDICILYERLLDCVHFRLAEADTVVRCQTTGGGVGLSDRRRRRHLVCLDRGRPADIVFSPS